VLLAEFRQGPQHLIDELAVLFLIVRIAYVFTYLGDRPTLRALLWSIRPPPRRCARFSGASASRSTSQFSSCRRSRRTCRRKVGKAIDLVACSPDERGRLACGIGRRV